jgi:hypothetical protein
MNHENKTSVPFYKTSVTASFIVSASPKGLHIHFIIKLHREMSYYQQISSDRDPFHKANCITGSTNITEDCEV